MEAMPIWEQSFWWREQSWVLSFWEEQRSFWEMLGHWQPIFAERHWKQISCWKQPRRQPQQFWQHELQQLSWPRRQQQRPQWAEAACEGEQECS